MSLITVFEVRQINTHTITEAYNITTILGEKKGLAQVDYH